MALNKLPSLSYLNPATSFMNNFQTTMALNKLYRIDLKDCQYIDFVTIKQASLRLKASKVLEVAYSEVSNPTTKLETSKIRLE